MNDMIEIYFPPLIEYLRDGTSVGALNWTYGGDDYEYLGVSQQLFAQAMGWA
jgi:hypothetical protein